ncbi:MAG: putative Oligoendopeptidase F, partial [Streblomastix strix]
DDEGNEVELSNGNYIKFLHSLNRDVRKGAWMAVYNAHIALKNTLTSTLAGQIKADIFMQKARRFNSCVERSLFEDDIDVSVYNSLIEAVHIKLPVFHKYLAIRQKVLNLDSLDMYDMYVPLVSNFDFKVTFEEARDIVLESLAPLGSEYVSIAKRGLTSVEEGGEAWADVFENQGKRSNCVSVQSYKLQPYMLLNFDGTLDSVFTLAHELGHSMHTYYSSHNQPHHTGIWRYITTEVPSTMNEALLNEYLMNKAKKEQNKKFELYLINKKCESFKGTLIRQTQFAEFERDVHQLAERGQALTPDSVSGLYKRINDEYYGDNNTDEGKRKKYPHNLQSSPLIAWEFARIPHFYYQYALAISVSDVLASRILEGKPADSLDRFFNFIKAGDSKSPLDIIADAGVDVRQPQPFINALDHFEILIQDLERLLKEVDDLDKHNQDENNDKQDQEEVNVKKKEKKKKD